MFRSSLRPTFYQTQMKASLFKRQRRTPNVKKIPTHPRHTKISQRRIWFDQICGLSTTMRPGLLISSVIVTVRRQSDKWWMQRAYVVSANDVCKHKESEGTPGSKMHSISLHGPLLPMWQRTQVEGLAALVLGAPPSPHRWPTL